MKVTVNKEADGYKLLGPDMRAFVARGGDVVDVLGGDYAESLVEDGLVAVYGETAVPKQAPPVDTPPVTAVDDLTKIKGLGKATAKKLEGNGISTFAELIAANSSLVAAQLGISENKLNEWQAEASRLQDGE